MEPTSTQPSTPTAIGLRYGVLVGLVSIILSLVLNATGMGQSAVSKAVTWVLIISGVLVTQRAFKQANAGFMSYGQGLGTGTVFAVIFGLLSGIFAYVYLAFVDQGMAEQILNKTRADMETRGASDAQIDQAMHWTGMFVSGPLLIVTVVLFCLFVGFVVSLITSIFIKHDKPEFE